jgi:hypothetical protein
MPLVPPRTTTLVLVVIAMSTLSSARLFLSFHGAAAAASPSNALYVACDTLSRKIKYSSRTATTDDHARPPLVSDAAGHRRG